MSQIYEWMNYDKMERLGWWCGKLWECSWTQCVDNNAVLTLLADRWRGDRLIRYGCEGLETPEDGRPFLREIEGVRMEDLYDNSRDIAGLFEEKRGEFCDACDDDGGYIGEVRKESPFELKLVWYRYVINTERKQFYDRERTAVHSVRDGVVFRDDLFPTLCTPYGRDEMVGGERLESWFGEVLAASNERPGADYEDITDVHAEWAAPTDLSDEEILEYVTQGAPSFEDSPMPGTHMRPSGLRNYWSNRGNRTGGVRMRTKHGWHWGDCGD